MQPLSCTLRIPDKSPQGYRSLAYTQWGDADNHRVLLCVHGLSRSGRDFDYLAEAMAAEYRVICVDVAGRGKSDYMVDKKSYNYQTYVADILCLLKQLSITNLDWVGTSMGGIIALLVNAHQPQLIGRLVLNDIGPFIPGAALDRIIHYVQQNTGFSSRTEAEKELRARMSTFGIDEEWQWQHIIEHTIVENGDGSYRFAYDPNIVSKLPLLVRVLGNLRHPSRLGKTPDIKLWQFWEKVRCPVLVLHGGQSDILSAETCQRMAQTHPSTRIVTYPGIGHAPMLMDLGQIGVVREFLTANS